MTRLGIIGAGNMAEALVAGVIKAGLLDPSRILMSDVREDRLEHMAKRYKVKTTRDNIEVVRENETFLVAVKPQHVKEVLDEIAEVIAGHQLLICIAAGVSIRSIESRLVRPTAVIRVMPNAPSLVQEGAAGIAMGATATSSHRDMVITIFNAIGVAVQVEEEQMDAVTALSGSGPAYVFHMVDAMVDAGVKEGLAEDVARELAAQTVYGAARMLSFTMDTAEELIKRVASPGGTTEAALKTLDEKGWGRILREAIHSARVRSEELAQGS
jgi:pyrroline-5-carboxylate reductase